MAEKGGITGNRVRRRDVVQVVGKSRAIGAALAAAVLALSGCGTGDGEETTTAATATSAAEQPGNPWDLPLEQRPALFDPCTEIPDEAVDEGFGEPVRRVDKYVNHKPGELMSCGWAAASGTYDISVLSTWKGRADYIADRTIDVKDNVMHGRAGMLGLDNIDTSDRSCIQLFFSERGAVWLKLNLLGVFREFNGERWADSCKALEKVIEPIMAHYPKGSF